MNLLIGIIISIFILGVFYTVVAHVFFSTGIIAELRQMGEKRRYILLGIVLLSNLFLYVVLQKERYIYFWDYSGYWMNCIAHSDKMFSAPITTLWELKESIDCQEYNNFIPYLLALPLRMLGTEFVTYVLCVFNMFIVPTILGISGIVCMLLKKINKYSLNSFVISTLFSFMIVPLILPAFFGMVDSFCLLTSICIFLIIISGKMACKQFVFNFETAFLLLLTLIGRRYFAYEVIAFIFSFIVYTFFENFVEKNKENLKLNIKNFFLTGTLFCVSMVLFLRNFLLRSLMNDIKLAYSAYQSGDYLHNYYNIILYFGIITIFLALFGIAYLAINKKVRKYALFFILMFFVTSFLFYRIQSMGMHHYYTIILPILFCSAFSVCILHTKKIRIILYFIGLLNICFITGLCKNIQNPFINSMFASDMVISKKREDINEIRLLADHLNKLSAENSSIYVLASSTILNDSIIRCVNLPDELNAVPNIVNTPCVDLRDGFSTTFYDADFVVVAEPIQYHLDKEDQKVIGLLAEEFIKNGKISKKYKKISTYNLDENVSVYLYKRIKSFTMEDKVYLRDKFNKYYKSYPELFENRIMLE